MVNVKTNEEYQMGRNYRGHRHTKKQWTVQTQKSINTQRNQQHYTHNLIPVQQTISIQRNQQYAYTHICILKNTSFDNKSSVYCRFSGKLICTLYCNTCHMNCVWPYERGLLATTCSYLHLEHTSGLKAGTCT